MSLAELAMLNFRRGGPARACAQSPYGTAQPLPGGAPDDASGTGARVDCLILELTVEPGPGAVFNQRRDVDPDPPGFQRVVFLRDDSFNAVPWRRGEARGEAVRNLANGWFPLGVAHFFIVIQAHFGVKQLLLHGGRWPRLPRARFRPLESDARFA